MTRVVAAEPFALREAARILRAGGLVAFPTETVYGLGAVATDNAAVRRIFEVKGRPARNPLIVHVPDAEAARSMVVWSEQAAALTQAFWPGPLTLVLAQLADSGIARAASAGLHTLAVRAPAAPIAQALLRAAALPIAAPSANRSGRVSPTTAAHVAAGLAGRIELVLDGGACTVGLESTVVDLSAEPPRLLRPGGLTRARIEAVIGPLAAAGDAIRAPGQLASHYAPARPVRLNATAPRPDEAFLGFGALQRMDGGVGLNLSRSGSLTEAARNLFAMLHALDREPAQAIAVAPISNEGLGEAINDRLRRAAAAAPRDGGRSGD